MSPIPSNTLDGALRRAAERLARAGAPEPRAEAEYLLANLLGLDRGRLPAHRRDPLDPDVAERYAEWVRRRARREPCQHIIGSQEFYGLDLRVDHRVLVPRSETEGLIDAVLGLELPRRAVVADLGTGSGCIAIALAVQRRDFELFALDVDADALELARENARRHDVDDRIDFTRADLAEPPSGWFGRMDAVVSNPPYVSAEEWERLEPEVRDHDPRVALVPGPTGLEAYDLLVHSAYELLRPEGSLVLELGFGQSDAVRDRVGSAGFRAIEIQPDLRGIPRVLVAERP